MIIGSATIRLKAVSEARLPVSHGRLLHAALLDIVRDMDPELSSFMHDSQINNFSVSLLKLSVPATAYTYIVKEGVTAYWRIGVIGDRLLKLLWNLPKGLEIRLGTATFVLDAVFKKDEKGSGIARVDTDMLEETVLELQTKKSLTIKFLAPTTFSGIIGEYPFPLPKMIFASLADKWNIYSSSTAFDVKYVKEISEYLTPKRWEGRSCVYNISPKRSVPSFVGCFTYDLCGLPPEYREIFLILAEFGRYTGVGKHTGQGMGRIEIEYE